MDSIATNFASPRWLELYYWQAKISDHIQTLGRNGILVGESSSTVAQLLTFEIESLVSWFPWNINEEYIERGIYEVIRIAWEIL
jgi:hypothetical protein